MNKIISIKWEPVTLPLLTTFSTSLGKKHFLSNMLVTAQLDDSRNVYAEIPTSFASPHETLGVIDSFLWENNTDLLSFNTDEYEELGTYLRKNYPGYPLTNAGIELLFFRAGLHQNESSFWGDSSTSIQTDITLPFLADSSELETWLISCLKKGFTRIKIKLSGELDADKKILSFVFSFLQTKKDSFEIRIDGNQGFSQDTFLHLIDFITINKYPIELFEQPLPKNDYSGHQVIKNCSPIPIILDESLWNIHNLERIIAEDCAHGVNIKLAKSGISESKKMIEIAQKNNLKLMIGCMTETMTGLSAGIYCAAGTGAFDYIDLDSVHLYDYKNTWPDIEVNSPEYKISVKRGADSG